MTRTAEQSMDDDAKLAMHDSDTKSPVKPLLAMPVTQAVAIIASVQLD